MNVNKIMAELERKHPGESEYLQAVREVLMTVEDAYNSLRNTGRSCFPDIRSSPAVKKSTAW